MVSHRILQDLIQLAIRNLFSDISMLSSIRTALIADIYDLIVVDFLLQSTK